MSENKVRFGISKLHVGKFNVSDAGVVTLGAPMHIPGTTKLSLDPDVELTEFWADNVLYWICQNDNGFTGEIENASFPDAFKTGFLNYLTLADGGIAQIKGRNIEPVYLMFESDGDQEQSRGIIYNVSLGQIKREHNTIEKTKTPQVATLGFTAHGDNGTGIIKAEYRPTASGYSTLFTNPPVPALPA